jgi:dTDP-4-dehydrorhamnose 3,5-epimerase
MIDPAGTDVIRAWQGHRNERKWFYVVSGKFKVAAVEVDDWENPSADLVCYEFDLSADKPAILQIPAGYANGFKALEPNSKVMIFSDFSLSDSIGDERRFDHHKWFDWQNCK